MSHNLSGLFDHIERDHQCALKNPKKVQLWVIVLENIIATIYSAKIALSFVCFFALCFALSEHCGVTIVQKLVGMRKFQKYIGTAQSFLTPPPNRPQF